MRKLIPLALSLGLGLSPLVATGPVPRKSPEFTIVEPSGKETQLSSFKGKVVLIEFLLTNCPHCMRVSQTLTTLHKELGPRGFQPIAIAFDVNITGAGVTRFAQRFGITYLMGYTSSDNVDSYLGREPADRLQVPQIVVIDRAGVIRAQSPPRGDPNLEQENPLRYLINALLKEAPPADNTNKVTSPQKK
jgi:peroxiredoxin